LDMSTPFLSVVVAVVDGDAALRRCLTALRTQVAAPSMEILVPLDLSVAAVEALAAAGDAGHGPIVRCLPMGRLETQHAPSSPLGQHELIDRRRSAGLDAARGEIIAMVEDRAVPRSDWAATLLRLHRELPTLVIGGAIENGREALLNWAVYYCDFGRYQTPFEAGPRRHVSDVNVSYKRQALEMTRAIWQVRYHEPHVHGALARAGEVPFASPDLVVEECRDNLTLGAVLRERFWWGRLFSSMRVSETSAVERVLLAGVSPFVPAVLFSRFLRDRVKKKTPVLQLFRVSPAVALLLSCWAAGEAVGYLLPPGWGQPR